MSLNASLSSYINSQANSLLAPYAAPLKSVGAPSVGMPSYSASASSSASSGPSKSGDISGGTAFNIGGINLGQQYETPATVSGGNPTSTLSSLTGINLTTVALIGAAVFVAILVLRR